ncbi:protein-glutamine gamma-glutamyltransferase 2 [Alosa sapidissima]|uniref:protein-glutamine gamma-glutamyltransferase 2 n=1 Tax=Alosa sapidissima TaxID=34773 RepID=UPI001C09EA31|nr:protein-glutamine gamma-glutamyltransferase 2 [Alosa sapidissima]
MAAYLDLGSWDLACSSNNIGHHTDLNGLDRLIVRRGQAFTINLCLRSGEYEPGKHSLSLIAETGPQPSEESCTRAVFCVSDEADETRWSATVSSPSSGWLALTISAAPDAPIGRYSLTLDQSGYKVSLGEFLMLFNPWCPRDAVYMADEEALKEYVLSQDGIIFRGSYKYPIGSAWEFGQYETGILDACLRILEVNPKCLRNPPEDCAARSNPVYVTRVISAMVNSNDQDYGVLTGKWKEPFDDGVSPMSWRGSVEILQDWHQSGCRAVRYGQCWVFAAVACSVARALGIPCRVITNYLSAHDTNQNLVIERYIDEKGQPINRTRDSIWNYHCWVESWMNRPDLPAGYDGWQASDSTPQERSENVFCCGPVPLKAIKEGQLNMKYDAPFVFAEVNADVKTFMKRPDGTTKEVISSAFVGQHISTKSVGSDQREDITHLYKYPEGSEEERESFKRAEHLIKLQQDKEVGLDVKIKVSSSMKKGCDFDVFAVVKNKTASDKKCRLVFASRAASYSGILGNDCGYKDLLNVELPPEGERSVPLRLNYSKYCNSLTEDNLIRLVALLVDRGNGDMILAVRNIVLENPEIKIRVLGEPKMNRKLAAEITVHNPLPVPLTGCCFKVEGANLTGGKTITEKLPSTVEAGQEAKVKVYFTPSHWGLRKLVVDFDSDKLCHVQGYRNVIIGK